MAITLSIAGTDRSGITVASSISIQMRSNGQQWNASFTLRVLSGTYRPLVGQAVAITEDGLARFCGTIDEVEESRIVGGSVTDKVFLRCLCTDLSARLAQRFADTPKTYKSVTAAYILLDQLGLISAGDEGITYAASGSGGRVYDGATITKYVVDHQSVGRIADDLARLSGYIWGVDATGVFYFHARTAKPASWSISHAVKNYTRLVSRKTREDYYNESWTRISWSAFSPTVETFHGDGVVRSWSLAHDAALVESITLNGDPVEFGGEGEGRKYTWLYGEKTITQDTGETVLTGGDDLVVTYRELGSDWIYVGDTYAIGERASVEGNSGHYGRTFEETDQTNETAASDKATAALQTAAVIPVVVTIETRGNYFQPSPGEVANITTDAPILAGSYLVQEVSAQQEGDQFRYSITALNGTRIGNWIDYFAALANRGVANPAASGSGTSPEGSAPGSVTLGTPTAQESDDRRTLRITQPFTAPSPIGTFRGIWIQVEAPDQSGSDYARLDGTTLLDGSATLGGPPKPTTHGPYTYDAAKPWAAVEIPRPYTEMDVRIRAISYSDQITNDAAGSPSTTLHYTPADTPGKPNSGTAYADCVTGLSFEVRVLVVGGVSMTEVYCTFTRPASARPWDGLQVCIEYATADGGTTTDRGKIWESGQRSNYFPTPPLQTAKAYALSYAIINDLDCVNPYVPGITPETTVSLGNVEGPTGTEYANNASLGPPVVTRRVVGGVDTTFVHMPFTPPDDPRFYGVYVRVTYTTDDGGTTTNVGVIQDGSGADPSNYFPTPNTVQSATIEVRSYSVIEGTDSVNTSGPSTTVTIGTTGGTVDPTKFVNSLLEGAEFEVSGGKFRMKGIDLTKSFNFNANEYEVVSGEFRLKVLSADKILAGVLQVGGAPSGGRRVPQLKVFDNATTPNQIGWIGDSGTGYVGAWFKRLYIGGNDPSTAKIIADASGNVAISGSLIVGAVGSATNASNVPASGVGAGTLPGGVLYVGSINASQITAGTITTSGLGVGVTVKYSGGNNRLELWPAFITMYNASNVEGMEMVVTDGMGSWLKLNGSTGSEIIGLNAFNGLPGNVCGLYIFGNRVVTARQPAVTAPTGGTTVDSQARTAIADIINRLATHGLIS